MKRNLIQERTGQPGRLMLRRRLFQPPGDAEAGDVAGLTRKVWKIEGAERLALVRLPKKTDGAPLIFGFHGHGGTAQYAARRFRLHALWPEAIVVYPQGLATVTSRDPKGERAGWNMAPFASNRDLRLFDEMLKTARGEWKSDEKRAYVMGHSNGGGFTFLLWGERGETFAALSPVAAGGARLIAGAKPCPLLQIGAKNDDIVPFSTQQAAFDAARRVNGSAAPSEFVTHENRHAFPADAPEKIVGFFKKHAKK